MAGAVESLLSIAGIGPARTATSSSLARSTSVVVAETRTTATVAVVTTSSVARTSAVVTTASAAKSTMGPVQVTTVRSTSSIEKTTMRSTTIPISTTRVSSNSASTSARTTRSVSVTTLTSTSTPSSSSSSSSASSTSARSTTVDTLGVPPVSATASAGAAEEGFKMSSGIIAAIVIASLLAVLALALVGYRYYKRHARKNSRRISGLSAWAGQGGWKGEDRYEKHEEDGTAGRWDGGEKERVSPFPVNAGPSQSLGYEQGYDHGYSHSGYPPQSHYAPQQAYDNYQAQHAQAAPYQEFNKNLPLPPQPVSMGMAQPQAGWMPGTPHTFGSFASTDGVDPGAAASMVMSARDDPLAAARATGLNDGSEVVVKQGFVRSLDDELVIVVGEKLTLVQAYDDGWSLCEKVGPNGMMERGVVPLNCLEVFSGKTMAEESVSMPQPAVVGHIGKPEETSPAAGQEFLAMPSPSKAGKMTRSSTAHSLAVSERSERRSSLFLNAAAAGLWLQTQPSGAARP